MTETMSMKEKLLAAKNGLSKAFNSRAGLAMLGTANTAVALRNVFLCVTAATTGGIVLPIIFGLAACYFGQNAIREFKQVRAMTKNPSARQRGLSRSG
jgi:hypothetical protein